ncbi:MAG: hypothetical protein OXC26_04905 [Albidovulum sp.]|nr:hypothetical protein [Albidovulum sp.]
MNADRTVLTDAIRARIERMLPGKATDPGATAAENRRFPGAVLWRIRTMFNPDLAGQDHAARRNGKGEIARQSGVGQINPLPKVGSPRDTDMRLLQPAPVEVADRSKQV